jgi:hydrogenase maturation protease
MSTRAPTLIIGYGNPSRGDDALGPMAIAQIEDRIQAHPEWGQIELVTDFQLQIEFVTDLVGRERVIFIDATAQGNDGFEFAPLLAKHETPTTSHALEPARLLGVFENFYSYAAPPCYLLAISGYGFELGEPMSEPANANLDAALNMLGQWLSAQHMALTCHA